MDRSTWTTHCLGRLLIDLPPGTKVVSSFDIWRPTIERFPSTPQSFSELISKREKSLGNSLLIRKVDHGNGSTTLLYRDPELPEDSRFLRKETYLVARGSWNTYKYEGGLSSDREKTSLDFSHSLSDRIISLEKGEIPNSTGFCIDGAIITGNAYQAEHFTSSLRAPQYPGASLEFSSITTAVAEKPLLMRGGGVAAIGNSLELIKEGARHTRSIEGEERLLKGAENGRTFYMFAWEAPGKVDSVAHPNVSLVLRSVSGSSASEQTGQPFKSDEEAVDFWDAVVESIRLRPGST